MILLISISKRTWRSTCTSSDTTLQLWQTRIKQPTKCYLGKTWPIVCFNLFPQQTNLPGVLELQGIQFTPHLSIFCCLCFDLLLPGLQLLEFDLHGSQFVQLYAGSVGHGLFDIEKKFQKQYCHTLKYLILGCEYLLECVCLSIGFFENFQNFSISYSHFS
jgi:hypothetical protein